MPSDVNLLIASVLDSFQSAIFVGGAWDPAPFTDVTWADPSGTGAFYTGYDGTNAWATGAALFDMANLAALSSGQAIANVRLAYSSSQVLAGNELITYCKLTTNASQSIVHHVATSGVSSQPLIAPPGRAAGSDWRTDINSLQLEVNGYRGNPTPGVKIHDYDGLWLVAAVHNRPSISVTAPPAGGTVTTTARPTVTWTFTGDGLSQSHFRVRVFTAAQYGAGGFNPQTSTATYDSGWTASSSLSHTLPVNLTNGTTYRAYVMAAQTLPGSLYRHETVDGTTLATLGATQYRQFTISLATPPVPTAILPASGSTQTTDLPVLGATLGASTVVGSLVRAEWQLATDAGFATNMRFATQAASDAVASGSVLMTLPSVGELFQGTWYIRARSLDSNGLVSAWSSSHSFTVAHAPTAIANTPSGQVSRVSGDTTFSWTFSDTSPTDVQTAFQVIVERNSDGVQLYDSGKVTSALSQHTMAISSTYEDVLLRWKVRVYDSDDVVGAYSATAQWYPRAAPVITVVAPVSPVEQPNPTYSFTIQPGRTIAQYRFVTYIQGTATLVDDSGPQTGSVASYQVVSPLQNATDYTVYSYVVDSGGLDAVENTDFTTAWTPPDTPTFTIDQTNFDVYGHIEVSWAQTPDASFYAYRVYGRNEEQTLVFGLLAEVTTEFAPGNYHAFIKNVPANLEYDIVVTQVAYRFGELVESSLNVGIQSDTFVSTHYWLLDPGGVYDVRMGRVTADSFTDEFEQEEMLLQGRGRRVEKGTRWGVRGSLEGYIRDETGQPAHTARLNLEAMRRGSGTLYLRTPFGDVWTVAISDIQFEREAGVGINEYLTYSLDYVEVVE